MRRLALVLLVHVAAIAVLYSVTWAPARSRASGQGSSVPDIPAGTDPGARIVPPNGDPVAIHGAQGLRLASDPEPVKVTDPVTGASIVVPDFVRQEIEAREVRPASARASDRQALQAVNVRVSVYREPRTVEEARGLIEGRPGARARILRWYVVAPLAEAEWLREGLSLTDRKARSASRDATLTVKGGFLLQDLEEGITVEGQEVELEPGRGRAHGRGLFEVRHEAFSLAGRDLELERDNGHEKVHVMKDVTLRILKDLAGADGRPLLAFGGEGFKPGFVTAEGGAVLTREEAFGRETLRASLEHHVHAEQEGGRTLDAERTLVVAHRGVVAAGAPRPRWHLDTFDAEGGVVVEYPDVTERGRRYLVSLAGQKLHHEVMEDGTATSILLGEPRIELHGDVPLQGVALSKPMGTLRASAEESARIETPDPVEIGPGARPEDYLRIVLEKGARLEREDVGLADDWDRLEGDELTLLLEKVPPTGGQTTRPEGLGPAGSGERLVATSFALLGNVRLGGTRMSGTTDRLVGEHLDSDEPVVVAEGPGTSFAFHGLRSGERLLGGHGPGAAGKTGDGVATPTRERESWVLQSLRADGDVVATTSFGGATVGLPVRIEGAALAYDRISDRARLLGGGTAPARVAVGDPSGPRHTVAARSMSFERAEGIVTADGGVSASVYVAMDAPRSVGLGALGLRSPEVGSPTTIGVTTSGRIEIRARLSPSPRRPRLDADQEIRIEGDVRAELATATTAVDEIRADTLQVSLRRTVLEPTAPPLGGVASLGGGGARPTRSPAAAGAPPPKRVRWDLTSDRLSARLDANGLVGLEAIGQAKLEGPDGTIQGRRIAYDAVHHEATADGTPRAQAIFGPEDARNEVWAPTLTLWLGTNGPERLEASSSPGVPAVAVLIRRDRAASTWERFTVTCSAPIEVNPRELTSDGPIEIRRLVRRAPGADWGAPATLWADRLTVAGNDLLSRAGADVREVEASGPHTVFEVGQAEKRIRIWGDRFRLDVVHSMAILTGEGTRDLAFQRGPDENPSIVSRQRRIVIDLQTGNLKEVDPTEIILRGATR